MLPVFDDDGLLPPGDYHLSMEELRESMLVAGPTKGYPGWNVKWRRTLVDNLGILVSQLRKAGITSLCIGGSFVEDRYRPNDIDGYFYCDFSMFATGKLQRELNKLDPHAAWGWDSKNLVRDSRGKPHSPLWHRYRIDLFPNHGQGTGIFDDSGNERTFYSLMRWSQRVKRVRGVIQIKLEDNHDSK